MDGLPYDSVLLPDGRILIGGNFQTIDGVPRPGLARLLSNGALDSSFAPPVAGTGAFGKSIVNNVAVLPDGKILAAGPISFRTSGGVLRTNIIRFNADGSLDATFDSRDIQHFQGLTLASDGKPIVAVWTPFTGVVRPVRLNSDGSQDSSFASSGAYTPTLFPLQLSSQADGTVLGLAGDNDPNRGGNAQLFRLNANGTTDTTFKFGAQFTPVMDDSLVAVAPDGGILAGVYEGQVPVIARFNPDGSRDLNFRFAGQPNGQGLYPVPAAWLPDGGCVVVRQPTAGDRRYSFFYLNPQGKLTGSRDLPGASFDNGVVGLGTLRARAFAMQPDGKLLFAAAFLNGSQNHFSMFRLPPPPAPVAPTITQHPVSASIGAGDGLFLTVVATSESPLSYQWFHSSTNLPGQTNLNLSLGSNSRERSGEFYVVVTNLFGASTSQVATISVRAPAPMVFTQQPIGGSVRLSQNFGLSAQFRTEVEASFQWFKDGVSFPNGAGLGFGFANLNLPANDPNRSGDYFVVITNAFGGSLTSTVARVDVILPGPPKLTSEPIDVSLYASQPLLLSVSAIADGTLLYQWQRNGTNLSPSATAPSVTASLLNVSAQDSNRFGDYRVIVSLDPGGNTTSRIAHVSLLPPGPPIILSQPTSARLGFASSGALQIAYNGEPPLGIIWQRNGTNLDVRQFPFVPAPATNTLTVLGLPAWAGDYRAILTNRFGATTSSVVQVSIDPPPLAEIRRDLTNVTVSVGEFNTANLTSGLVVNNCCGQLETTHILALTPEGPGAFPLNATSTWHLAIGASNRFYVGAQAGFQTTLGSWGFFPGAGTFTGLFLTNFPTSGLVSRLEAFENGRYGIVGAAGGSSGGQQSGSFRVLGPRRPATNVFAIDIVSSNSVQVSWFKDGLPIDNQRGSSQGYQLLEESLGNPPSSTGVNRRFKLILPDVKPSDAGRFHATVANLINNPDRSAGQPAQLFIPGGSSSVVTLNLRGYAESEAPQILEASELQNLTALDELTAMALLPDRSSLLAIRSQTFGPGSSTTTVLVHRDASGATNGLAIQISETANSGALGTIKALAPDGLGGAWLAGDGASGTLDPWFLRRVQPATLTVGTNVSRTFTNLWTSRTAGPFSDEIQNLGVQRSADVVGLLPLKDGVIVAGHFTGRPRFGAVNVVTNPAIPFFTAKVGGISVTNAFDLAFNRADGSKDLYVARFDLLGQLLWVKSFGGTNNEQLTSISADALGNLYLAGSFKTRTVFGPFTLESTKSPAGFYASDGFVAKLSPDASPIWIRNFGGLRDSATAETSIAACVVDAQGGVYFAANRNGGQAAIQPGLLIGAHYLARLNLNGELLWTQEFTSQGNTLLALDPHGNVALVDTSSFSSVPIPITFGASTLIMKNGGASLAAKFSPNGNALWLRPLDERVPFNDDPRSFTPFKALFDVSGELVIAGKFTGGIQSASSRTAGQQFDLFELSTTNNATINPSDILILRLADAFRPSAPQIKSPPTATTAQLQDRVVLGATVDAFPAPQYQWLRNGAPLLGATNRLLILPELARTNAGLYSLVVSNGFGSTTSPAAALTANLRPTMSGWTQVTTTTNFLGTPSRVGLDDFGAVYLAHLDHGLGNLVSLDKFNPDGSFAWRFSEPSTPGINGQPVAYAINPKFTPLVTPAGDVFLAGRTSFSRFGSVVPDGNFIGKINPASGRFLWVSNNFGVVGSQIAAVESDLNGGVRVLLTDRSLQHFDATGSLLSKRTFLTLPTTTGDTYSRTALTRDGGFYFYANRVEALNLGSTNLPALATQGAQTWVLARFDTTGSLLWFKSFGGQSTGVVDPFRLLVDAADQAIIVGSLGAGNQANLKFQFGTNQLTGFGYAAKVSTSGDVLWAKSWWLHIDDAALRPDGAITFGGWFRLNPLAQPGDRRISFGPEIVSAAYSHDTFVAQLTAEGKESFIRQSGSPDFATFDNARDYYVAVNTSGTVVTAGFSLFLPASAALDFGDIRYTWPDLRPYNILNSFGTLPTYYVARLEPNPRPSTPSVVVFERPQPGATSLRLSWPPTLRLQQRSSLGSTPWITLPVQPPFDVNLLQSAEGYFRLITAPYP